jgi:hypothetical protein
MQTPKAGRRTRQPRRPWWEGLMSKVQEERNCHIRPIFTTPEGNGKLQRCEQLDTISIMRLSTAMIVLPQISTFVDFRPALLSKEINHPERTDTGEK